MTALRPDLDLRPTLQEVRTTGAAFVNHALDDTFIHQLRAETDALGLQPMPRQEGPARQEGEVHALHEPFPGQPAIRELRDELVHLVHAHGATIPGCTAWRPNEVHVQRYHAGTLGITPHLDRKRHHYLVAIFTVEGSAAFTICKNRGGDALLTLPTDPGSLVLLRGPGMADIEDGRPLHAVAGPPTGQRTSLSYRMNTHLTTASPTLT